jgi:hypothetical protein
MPCQLNDFYACKSHLPEMGLQPRISQDRPSDLFPYCNIHPRSRLSVDHSQTHPLPLVVEMTALPRHWLRQTPWRSLWCPPHLSIQRRLYEKDAFCYGNRLLADHSTGQSPQDAPVPTKNQGLHSHSDGVSAMPLAKESVNPVEPGRSRLIAQRPDEIWVRRTESPQKIFVYFAGLFVATRIRVSGRAALPNPVHGQRASNSDEASALS